jgi:hypothetical protein
MRATQFTFFMILILLTTFLIVIIVGESNFFNNNTPQEIVELVELPQIEEEQLPVQSLVSTDEEYQSSVIHIIDQGQESVLNNTNTRPQALLQMREQLLSLDVIPESMQDIHLQLVLVLTKDISVLADNFSDLYQNIIFENNWLANTLTLFLALS